MLNLSNNIIIIIGVAGVIVPLLLVLLLVKPKCPGLIIR